MEFGGKAWIRWPIGLFAVVLAFRSAYKVVNSGGGLGAVGPLLFSVSLLIVAAICFCPEVVRTIASPLTRWIDSIYLPGGRPDRAPLSLRLAEYYEKTRQFELAASEYHRILEDHPERSEVYSGLVRLYCDEFDDRRAARRWLKRGLRRVSDDDGREQLREEFGSLLKPEDKRLHA